MNIAMGSGQAITAVSTVNAKTLRRPADAGAAAALSVSRLPARRDAAAERLGELLRAKHIRPTARRLEVMLVLDADLREGRHGLMPVAVHLEARLRGSDISQAGVYAVLQVLTEAGLVERRRLDKGAALFALHRDDAQTLRLVCRCCGQVETVADDRLGARLRALANQGRIGTPDLTLSLQGRCKACVANGRVGRRGAAASPQARAALIHNF